MHQENYKYILLHMYEIYKDKHNTLEKIQFLIEKLLKS